MLLPFLLLMQAAVVPSPVPTLHQAISRYDSSTAETLINAGADPNSRDRHGHTPLHIATVAYGPGKKALMNLLLTKGADANARDDFGASPLDDAAWNGLAERAQVLLDAGARINDRQTKTGATPLNEAACKGHIDVVELLLTHGADAGIRDRAGFLPIENAIREHHPEVMNVLLTHGKDAILLTHLLEDAVRRGQQDSVTILLDAGAAVDAHFASGSTALFDAALKGDNGLVSLLVYRDAKVNEREIASLTTPLYAAAAFGREDVVTTLLLWGADPNLVGKDGITPLQAAESNGYPQIAKQLRKAAGH